MFWIQKTNRFEKGVAIGETIAVGQPVAVSPADGLLYKADANAANKYPAVGFAEFSRTYSATETRYMGIVTEGLLDVTSLSLDIANGVPVFLSQTAGGIIQDTSGYATSIQCLGYLVSSTKLSVKMQYSALGVLSANGVITEYINALAVTEPKLSAKAKVQKFVSDVWDFDASGATNVDALLFNSGSTPIEITKVRLMYTIASANDDGVAATSFKIGTAAFGGEEVVAAAGGLVVKNKAIGTYTDLTIVEGTVAANTTLFCRMAGVAATLAGAARIIIEYNTLES